MHTMFHDENMIERHRNAPEFLSAQRGAADYLFWRARRVAHSLAAVLGGFSREHQTASLDSLVAEAREWHTKFIKSQFAGKPRPMEPTCKGPDLVVSTSNLQRVKTLLADIIIDVHHWSDSVSLTWAEDHTTLRVRAAKLEIEFKRLPHTVPYVSSRNEGLGWGVAVQVLTDAKGRFEITPGQPASIRLWLPLDLPEGS